MFESRSEKPAFAGSSMQLGSVLKDEKLPEVSLRDGTMLIWMEHCTECAMPACFATCEFYTPRQDFKCSRFTKPMDAVFVDHRGVSWRELGFRKWAKIEAKGKVSVLHNGRIPLAERIEGLGDSLVDVLPLSYGNRVRASHKWNQAKQRFGRAVAGGTHRKPTHFKAEFVNEGQPTHLLLTIRSVPDPRKQFQEIIEIPRGFHAASVNVAPFFAAVGEDEEFFVSLNLQGDQSGVTLGMGYVDLVDDAASAASPSRPSAPDTAAAPAASSSGDYKKAKCVVWDLDNTLWKGTLIEDGIDKVELREEIAEIIKQLDQRGILNSIASKNNHDDAMAAVRKFGLEEYFLYPQISWGPKSMAVDAIAKSINIGIDTFIFVDDQPFEREEVGTAHPQVQVIDQNEALDILSLPRCDVPVTKDSQQRRSFYQSQIQRETAMAGSANDYTSFLKSCNIEMHIKPVTDASLNRVHELSQRTNQMNFSGNRYTKDQIVKLAEDPNKETYVIECMDKFGEYGTVGFGVVDKENWVLEDLMFSCRIQAKTVEHHLLEHMVEQARSHGAERFKANYRKTPKNAPSGQVFDDLGFATEGKDGDVLHLDLPIETFERHYDFITIKSARDGQ